MNENQDESSKLVMVFRLTSQILNMEIQLVKSNDRNKAVEQKLIEKSNLLENTQKELARCKKELAKLKLKIDNLPMVRSELLNVISLTYNLISFLKCVTLLLV